MPAANDIRRVVTTHDASGKAIVGYDNVAPQTGGEAELGVKVFNLWVTDSTPADISGKADAATLKVGIPPPPNGYAAYCGIPSDPESGRPRSEFPRQDRRPGCRGRGKPGAKPARHPGMHRTRSIDYAIVLAGEIDMLLLDDLTSILRPATCWCSRAPFTPGSIAARSLVDIAFILIDAKDI